MPTSEELNVFGAHPLADHSPGSENHSTSAPLPPIPARLSSVSRKRIPLSVWLLVFLIPYALTATFGLVYFWQSRWNQQRQQHVLETLPDQGLYEDFLDGKRREAINPVSKAGEKPVNHQVISPQEALSGEITPVGLGMTRRVGALAVTPLEVRHQRLRFDYKQGQTDVEGEEGLVLKLEVRNEGKLIFRPDDETFNRAYVDDSRLPMYTYLETGKFRFYGIINDPTTERLNFPICPALLPDQVGNIYVTAFLAADGKTRVTSLLDLGDKKWLWRVHLRRGKEEIPLSSGRRRAIWLTSIIPVEFSTQDIKREKKLD